MMTNPMIERVAKAIEEELGKDAAVLRNDIDEDCYPVPYKFYFDGHFDMKAVVLAAIAAMREPTEEMAKRGDDASGALAITHDSSGVYVWQAMIDEALKEE